MKVLLTRSTQDNERIAALLEVHGVEAIQLPVQEYVATKEPSPEIRPDFCIFTSANAVQILEQRAFEALKNLPAFAVGKQTSKALADASYKKILSSNETANQLVDEVLKYQGELNLRSGIYPCADLRAYDIKASLERSNIDLENWEVYRAQPLNVSREELHFALNIVENGILAVFSAESGKRFVNLVFRYGLEHLLLKISVVAISKKATAHLNSAGFAAISWVETPNTDLVIDKILNQIQ